MDRKTGSIALIVILIACTIAIVAFVMNNGSTPIGPAGSSTSTTNSAFLTVELPSDSENISIFRTDSAIVIDELVCVLLSGTSITIDPRHGTNRSLSGNALLNSPTAITSLTTGTSITSFDDPTIPQSSFVWFETTAESGTPSEINCTFHFTIG